MSAVNRLAYGATLALVLTAVLAPSATASDVGGGTPIGGLAAEAAAPTATAPAPVKVSVTRAVSLTRSQTRSVQRRVNVRPDGKIGAKTRTAIRRYQLRRSL